MDFTNLSRLLGKKAEEDKQQDPEAYSKLGSAGMGALESGTMGFADEIGGAVKAPMGALDAALGRESEDSKKYKESRDSIRSEFDKAKENNPISYGAGNLGTTLAMSAIPGVGIAKNAGIAKTLGMGALNSLGASSAEDKLDVAKDMLKGAGISGLLGGGINPKAMISKAVNPIEKLAEAAIKKEAPAAGGFMSRQIAEREAEKAAIEAAKQKAAVAAGKEVPEIAKAPLENALKQSEVSSTAYDLNGLTGRFAKEHNKTQTALNELRRAQNTDAAIRAKKEAIRKMLGK